MSERLEFLLAPTTTPARITPDVLTLCEGIRPGARPEFVPVRPASWEGVGDCYNNAARAAEGGGSVVHGWAVWLNPGFLVEAEHHAVWRDPAGRLVDVTPHPAGERVILFLPDPDRVWRRVPVANVRRPLVAHPLVAEFLCLCDERDRLTARTARPDGTRDPSPPGYGALSDRIGRLVVRIKSDVYARLDRRRRDQERKERRDEKRKRRRGG